jgi:Tfp pilus assembly protein PilW
MRLLLALLLSLALTGAVYAQVHLNRSDLEREAAIQQIGESVAEAQTILAQGAAQAGTFEDISSTVIAEAIKIIADLRESLVGNEYVRISGFTLTAGFPPSISVDFEFDDPSP